MTTAILELIGAGVKWSFEYMVSFFRKIRRRSFAEILDGKGKKAGYASYNIGMSNISLGIIVIILLCWLIIYLNILNPN